MGAKDVEGLHDHFEMEVSLVSPTSLRSLGPRGRWSSGTTATRFWPSAAYGATLLTWNALLRATGCAGARDASPAAAGSVAALHASRLRCHPH